MTPQQSSTPGSTVYVSGGIRISARLNLVNDVLFEFRRFVLCHGYPEENWPDLELAATEGLNNAIEHGAHLDPNQGIPVHWKWEDTRITLEILDPGNYLPNPDAIALPEDPLSERGRGTYLMHRLASTVHHSLTGSGHLLKLEFVAPSSPQLPAESPSASEETLQMMTEDLSSAYENLSALFRLSESLAASESFDLFLERSLLELSRLVDCDGIQVARFIGGKFENLSHCGAVPMAISEHLPFLPESVQGEAALKAMETTIENPADLSAADPLRHANGPMFCCPMALSHRVLGVLTLFLAPEKAYFTAGQLRLTRTFADVLAIAMSSDLLQQERKHQNRMVRELEIAAELQTRLLPKSFPNTPMWQAHGVCMSARQAGGDFFDLITLNEHSLVATVADVMGKGISAAMVGTIFRTIFHSALDLAANPATMLAHMADLTYREIHELEVFITAQVVLLNAAAGTILLAGAGHCPLLVISADGRIQSSAPNGFPLGLFDSPTYAQATLPLCPGDRILLMTDGLPESGDNVGKMLGMDGFESLVLKHRDKPCAEFCRVLLEEIESFTSGAEASDDRTLLVIDYLPPPNANP